MALSLDSLIAAVAAEKTVEASVITLLNGQAAQIQQLIKAGSPTNTVDPVALQAIVDGISANTQTLATAVTANTPVAPTPVVPAPPAPPAPPPPVV